MGLDISHGAWRGAYSAFMRFRNDLAEIAGFDVCVINWPEVRHNYIPQAVLDWGHMPLNAHQGDWEGIVPHALNGRPEPLLYLLMHSDCDGYLEPEAAGMLAERLEQLLPYVEDARSAEDPDRLQEKTRRFIDGARAAAAAGERLTFG